MRPDKKKSRNRNNLICRDINHLKDLSDSQNCTPNTQLDFNKINIRLDKFDRHGKPCQRRFLLYKKADIDLAEGKYRLDRCNLLNRFIQTKICRINIFHSGHKCYKIKDILHKFLEF